MRRSFALIVSVGLQLSWFGASSFASIGSLLLALHIWGGRGLAEGTRELLETPYIVVYSVDEAAGAIEVIVIVHGARDRQA